MNFWCSLYSIASLAFLSQHDRHEQRGNFLWFQNDSLSQSSGLLASRWCLHHYRYCYLNKFQISSLAKWQCEQSALKMGYENQAGFVCEQKAEIPHMRSAAGTHASEVLYRQYRKIDNQRQSEQNLSIWIGTLKTRKCVSESKPVFQYIWRSINLPWQNSQAS